ncbi:MAG TPA: MOSC domain-containing protein [Syntrophomonadaceae bacterium]|nr:MOSC domain-containing protein [Syntrophomonadaceae bacterium]
MKGKVLAVCISSKKGEKKIDMGKALFIQGHGISGDAHSGPWHRQVSLLSIDSVNKMRDMGADVGFGDFAENLNIEGFELFTLPIGTMMRVGQEVELEVTQIGKECHHGCAIRQQVGDCVMPREGIFARVITGGLVTTGDDIEVLSSSVAIQDVQDHKRAMHIL